MREALSAAYDAATEEPAAATETPSAAPVETPQETPAPPESAEANSATDGADGTERDEKGRFKSDGAKAGAAQEKDAAQLPAEGKEKPAESKEAKAAPAAVVRRAPQSWSPSAREHWAKLPPEVQAEVDKRERETAVALQGSSDARRVADNLNQIVAPYMGFLRAERNANGGVGVDPLQAINSLLSQAQVLRQGTPEVKGQTIAQWIKQFGIPLEAINTAMGFNPDGSAAAQPTQPQPAPVDPSAIEERIMSRLAEGQQQMEYRRQAENVQQFSAAHEFINGDDWTSVQIRNTMAALLEADGLEQVEAGRRGMEHVALPLEEAYGRACRMHPEVSKIVSQREAAKSAEAARAASQRTRAAASSVRSQPGGPTAGSLANMDDIRAHLDAAYEEVSSRR